MSWKTPITMLVLLGILLGAAYYGWSTIAGGDDAVTTSDPTEPTKSEPKCKYVRMFTKGQPIRADRIVVNVYNAGDVPGLAGDTMSALVAKGFKPGVADNAPEGRGTNNVTIVTSDPESPEVRMVRIQFQGLVRVANGELTRGIDVLVGDRFRGVDADSTTAFRLRKNIRSCTTVKN